MSLVWCIHRGWLGGFGQYVPPCAACGKGSNTKRPGLYECDSEVHVFIGRKKKCQCGQTTLTEGASPHD